LRSAFFDLLAARNVHCKVATFRDFPNLMIISEGQPARQLRLHVIFEKLAMPALPEHEVPYKLDWRSMN
jgi:hypothetical protein